jgi:site-specific recombinase XerD
VCESGAASANRAHAALSMFYAWAIDQGHFTGANPTADIKPLKQSGRFTAKAASNQDPRCATPQEAVTAAKVERENSRAG